MSRRFETVEYRKDFFGFSTAISGAETHQGYEELLGYLSGQPLKKIFMVYAVDSDRPGAPRRALFLWPNKAFY